jgi:uncharacterized protein YjiS (DUF1127 family)
MLKRFVKYFVVARTASVLSQLSDRQLNDIGIARCDIYSYADSINA